MDLIVKPHKTYAGIDWIGDSIPALTKILLTEWTSQRLEKLGISIEELRSQKSMPSGFRGRANADHFIQYVDHMSPEFHEHFRVHSTGHVFGYGRALTDRTFHSILKDEGKRFREPEWQAVRALVLNAIKLEQPMETWQRYAAHQKDIQMQVVNVPGVYVRQSAECDELIYVGSSGDNARRSKGHGNSGLYLRRVFATGDKPTAVKLEQSIHDKIVASNLVREVEFPLRPIGKQGRYRLEKGCNGRDFVDIIVKAHYQEFCRATIGL